MKHIGAILLTLTLSVVGGLIYFYPQKMVSPGKLIPEHHHMESNCFSCHTPFHGVTTESCATCHKPWEIGLKKTNGEMLQIPSFMKPFHESFLQLGCITCHQDHSKGQAIVRDPVVAHSTVAKEVKKQCEDCHSAPRDTLHQEISESCGQCHGEKQWLPANFDHDKYFLLDEHHNASCKTCHTSKDFSQYTCYGCHKHSPDRVARQHREGTRNLDKCAECHKSGHEHEGGEHEHGGGGGFGRERGGSMQFQGQGQSDSGVRIQNQGRSFSRNSGGGESSSNSDTVRFLRRDGERQRGENRGDRGDREHGDRGEHEHRREHDREHEHGRRRGGDDD